MMHVSFKKGVSKLVAVMLELLSVGRDSYYDGYHTKNDSSHTNHINRILIPIKYLFIN